jgi:hypothetical protein
MRIGFYTASAAALLSFAAGSASRAEPTLTSGIGLATCAKLGPDLKPGGGLEHVPNALLFYWTQGYVSAANFFLLNKYVDYIDVSAVKEPVITQLVFDFCKANPDKKPISAIDKFIRDSQKIAAKKSDAIDPWEHKATLVATTDDEKWINQCVKDNKDEKVKPEVVLKYCTCMNNRMDNNETRSITQWEKTHVAERRACDREAGWR